MTTGSHSFLTEMSTGVFEGTMRQGTVPEPASQHVLQTIEKLGGERAPRGAQLKAWAELVDRS
ncbi:MAG: hypothetical protein KDA44_05220 [Planctomycetales bacterium]|nr:hypothetical protein [Planctomycetales bacterium]